MKIVYTSNAGHTKRFAEMLAERLSMPILPLSLAKKQWDAGEEILYFGWLNAGKVEGLAAAKKKFSLSAVCAVGMGSPTPTVTKDIRELNGFSCPCFYLQGGFDIEKLHGANKIKMKIVRSMLLKKKKKEEDLTIEEKKLYDMIEHGADFVSPVKLNIVADWVESCRYIL